MTSITKLDRISNSIQISELLVRMSMIATSAILITAGIGWFNHTAVLASFIDGYPNMLPRTLLLFTLSTLSYHLQKNYPSSPKTVALGKLLSLLSLALTLVTLIEHAFHVDLGISSWFIGLNHESMIASIKPTPETTVLFTILNLGLLFFNSSIGTGIMISQLAGSIVGFWAEFLMISYLFRSPSMYSLFADDRTIGISLPTTLSFFFLSIALLSAHPNQGFMSLVFGNSPGGITLRRLFWLVVIIPLTLAIALAQTRRWGLHDPAIEDALSTMITIMIFFAFAWKTARKLEKLDCERQNAADALLRSREETLAIVSHDLKNPLTAIKLTSEVISKLTIPKLNLDSELNQRLLQQMQGIIRSSQIAEKLVADLLDFAKIEAGNLRIETSNVRLSDILDEVVLLMNPSADEHKIKLTAEYRDLEFIHCDRIRIVQALSNLVANAIKFSPENTQVWISATRTKNDDCLFSVKDQGPGMTEDTAAHIFERYWQPEITKHQGTGLGLSIVKGIAESHHGKVWVETRPGQGSIFYFTLPNYGTYSYK